MLRYKGENPVIRLAKAGYSVNRAAEEYDISRPMFTKIRKGYANISGTTIDKLCAMLKCQPGDLIEWIPDGEADELMKMPIHE